MSDYESKLVDSSRVLTEMLSAEVGSDVEKFEAYFRIAKTDNYPVSMRAARVLQFSTQNYPHLVLPYLTEIVHLLGKIKVDGVIRSFLKMLWISPVLPEEDSLGILTDYCLSALQNKHHAVAIRSYSLDILLRILIKYPELTRELYTIIESIDIESSPGMKAKYRKSLKLLRQRIISE